MTSYRLLFTETQRFRQPWLWVLLLGVIGFLVYTWFAGARAPEENSIFAFVLATSLGLVLLFLSIRLETKIDTEGVKVRFFPLHQSYRQFSWPEIKEAQVRQYSPLLEYGGWGIRYNFFGKGKAYTISGNQGLQLVLANGSRLLIGTHKPQEVKAALEQVNK